MSNASVAPSSKLDAAEEGTNLAASCRAAAFLGWLFSFFLQQIFYDVWTLQWCLLGVFTQHRRRAETSQTPILGLTQDHVGTQTGSSLLHLNYTGRASEGEHHLRLVVQGDPFLPPNTDFPSIPVAFPPSPSFYPATTQTLTSSVGDRTGPPGRVGGITLILLLTRPS